MNLTLTQLRYLVAVARHGSVTGAAKVLNVSQPSISVAIDAVEKNFSQKLFVYERAGEACRVCKSPVRQFVQGQRSTYRCSTCQR